MDDFFMTVALSEAKKAYESQEVPVGAVLVYEGKIIAKAHNKIESLQDATAHAEICCIQKASTILGNWRLVNTILYSTLEPCLMCMGAILLARIQTLVWAAPDLRHGALGSWINILDFKHPTHQIEVRKGVLENESAHLLKTFFQKRREDKKFSKN